MIGLAKKPLRTMMPNIMPKKITRNGFNINSQTAQNFLPQPQPEYIYNRQIEPQYIESNQQYNMHQPIDYIEEPQYTQEYPIHNTQPIAVPRIVNNIPKIFRCSKNYFVILLLIIIFSIEFIKEFYGIIKWIFPSVGDTFDPIYNSFLSSPIKKLIPDSIKDIINTLINIIWLIVVFICILIISFS